MDHATHCCAEPGRGVLPAERENEEDRQREESERDGVSVRKVSVFMVCFIKVTIIQWYIVLNSQKYEQIFTATHTHNGNTSLQNKLHTGDRVYTRTPLDFISSLLRRERGAQQKPLTFKSRDLFNANKGVERKMSQHSSRLLQTIPG